MGYERASGVDDRDRTVVDRLDDAGPDDGREHSDDLDVPAVPAGELRLERVEDLLNLSPLTGDIAFGIRQRNLNLGEFVVFQLRQGRQIPITENPVDRAMAFVRKIREELTSQTADLPSSRLSCCQHLRECFDEAARLFAGSALQLELHEIHPRVQQPPVVGKLGFDALGEISPGAKRVEVDRGEILDEVRIEHLVDPASLVGLCLCCHQQFAAKVGNGFTQLPPGGIMPKWRCGAPPVALPESPL